MTQPAALAHVEYVASGGLTYTYPFQIDAASELEVRVDGAVMTETSHYTLAGVGVPTGGSVTFFSPPMNGAIISLRLTVDIEQLLDLVPNAALPAVALEDQLDNIVRQIQMLEEFFSRTVQLPVGASSAFRYLQLPLPGANQVLGWNATGSALALFPSSIMTVTVSPSSGRAFGVTNTVVPAVAGQARLTAAAAYPSGVVIEGVSYRVTTTFGNANGLTTLTVGDVTNTSRWGGGLGRTADSTNNPGYWQSYTPFPTISSGAVLLTADLGTFDATGQALITTHWTTYATV